MVVMFKESAFKIIFALRKRYVKYVMISNVSMSTKYVASHHPHKKIATQETNGSINEQP